MAKKFFYNKVYNTKRTIINLVIIGVCVIGIIVCFIVTSNFQGENKNSPQGELSIKNEVTVEVNEKINKDIFFSKIENVDLDTIEINYPEDFKTNKVGDYEINILISGKNYTSNLKVVDTTKPILELKELTIKPNTSYIANEFVTSCTDNSEENCIIDFYKGVDEEGNEIDYSKYREAGTYPVKIAAKDSAGNQTVQETKLTITDDSSSKPPVNPENPEPETPTTCKYGNGEYDTENYLIAVDITTNNCAVSLDLYKDETLSAELNKLMESETTKIIKDVEALNLSGTLALNRKIIAVVNKTNNGIVGYELRMIVTITNNDQADTVVDYKVDKNGQRVFTTNPHNLKSE